MKMHLRPASQLDGTKLSEFYQSFQLAGPVQLEIQRGEDFFSFYDKLGKAYRSYILEDKDGIQGLASMMILDRKVLGKHTRIAYALDFRIKKSRAAVREWSQHFQPVLEELKSEEGCEYFFTSLQRSQVQAYNAFVRPRQARRQLPRYHLFRQFRLVSIHGRLPFAPEPLESLSFRRATKNDHGQLAAYLAKSSAGRPLQIDWESGGFDESLSHWPGLKLEDFYLAVTNKGQIVGAAAPWSMDDMKSYIPLSYTARADNFRQILKLGSWLRFARALPKPSWKNPNNAKLKFCLVTHLRADHEDIFDSLLSYIWEQVPKDHFLVYTHFEGEYWLRPSRHFINSSQPFSLYNIIPGGASLPEELTPIDDSPADLELSPMVY